MWHHGRCGSSVLGKLLNQHPEIRWYREIFERYSSRQEARPNFRDDIKRVRRKARERIPGIELKGLPSQHLQTIGVPLEEFVDVIREEEFTKCVVLHRKNILRKLISVQIVDQGLRDSFHLSTRSSGGLEGRLKVDVENVRILGKFAPLLEMIQYIDEETENARRLLSERFDILPLFYEDHIEADPTVAYRMVCDYLDVEFVEADVTLQRINTKPLPELVENCGEIEGLLSGTPYEWMLTG